FFHPPGAHRHLHSFPTRRSSDLPCCQAPARSLAAPGDGPRLWLQRVTHLVGADAQALAQAIEQVGAEAWWRPRAERARAGRGRRSEEHTSELQSLAYLVCRLLLE